MGVPMAGGWGDGDDGDPEDDGDAEAKWEEKKGVGVWSTTGCKFGDAMEARFADDSESWRLDERKQVEGNGRGERS